MNIYEFADVVGAEIEWLRYNNQGNRHIAHFRNCDIKEGAMLVGAYGDSDSPENALHEYVKRIAGATIVFNAGSSEYRQTFNVPKNLSLK